MVDETKRAKAYTELLEILKNTSKDAVDKIPKEVMDVFEKYRDKTYDFHFDTQKPLEKQDLLKETYVLMAVLYREYWATPEERMIYDKMLKTNSKKAKLEEYRKMLGEE